MVVMKGHVARRLREIFDAGCDHERLERAVDTFVDRRCRTALQLAEIYAELAQNELLPVAEQPQARRRAQEWINQHGWPTGARFVRGHNAGSYRYHPLGLERIPYHDWPHPRPSFEDITEAVAALPATLEGGRAAGIPTSPGEPGVLRPHKNGAS